MKSFPSKIAEYLKTKEAVCLIFLCLLYLMLALSYSLLTPAWEAPDEPDHLTYTEYVLSHKKLPPIAIKNGVESHQAPLYYVTLAVWQKALGIEPFRPEVTPAKNQTKIRASTTPRLWLSHDYSPVQRQQAVDLHQIRLLSVIFGLGTVVFTFLAAFALTKQLKFTMAAALFVVLLPKYLFVNAVVSNDSLVIMFCSALLYGAIKLCQAERGRTILLSFIMGLIAGAAMLTKLNSAPVAGLFILGIIAQGIIRKKFTYWAPLMYIVGVLLVCGWWLIYNMHYYGDPLAQSATNNYLSAAIPGLIKPVSWLNFHRLFIYVPSQLITNAWYVGSRNQIFVPLWMNISLWSVAIISLIGFGSLVLRDIKKHAASYKASYIFLVLAILGGLIAVMAIARTTTQSEGRETYIGLSAFAIVCTLGITEATRGKVSAKNKDKAFFVWPALLFLLNLYIFARILIPTHAL